MYSQSEMIRIFGQPGDESNLRFVDCYPMRLSWQTSKIISRVRCHRLAVPAFTKAFAAVEAAYPFAAERKELGIDLFGGLFVPRMQRGSLTRWSKHAWGTAIDIDPVRNGMYTPWLESQLSLPEYKPFVEAWENAGFVNLGRKIGRDAMHFEYYHA